MSISNKLMEMAKTLESKDNDALVLAETNEVYMTAVANACVKAANILKECADQMSIIEGHKLTINEGKQLLNALAATTFGNNVLSIELFDGAEKFGEAIGDSVELLNKLGNIEFPEDITVRVLIVAGQEGLDGVVKLAHVFDRLEDKGMNKIAEVLDELLLTVAADPNEYKKIKEAQKKQIDEIKKKYVDVKNKLHEVWGVENAKKKIDESVYTKKSRPLESPLSMRTCPNHPGAQIQRLSDEMFQCSLGREILDYKNGFTTEKGKVVPGGSVDHQTDVGMHSPAREMFNNREEHLSEMGVK